MEAKQMREEVIDMIKFMRRSTVLNKNIFRKKITQSFCKGLMCIFYLAEEDIFPPFKNIKVVG